MTEARNLNWLRRKVAGIVNFDIDSPDQDFYGTTDQPWIKIDDAINDAQELEWDACAQEGNSDRFTTTETIVWPAGQVELTLPSACESAQIQWINDVTSGWPGTPIWVVPRQGSLTPTLSWKDSHTLRWGITGPAITKTLVILYLGRPTDLVDVNDEPWWVPSTHRLLLAWSAATILFDQSDREAPIAWQRRVAEMRWRFWNYMCQARPNEPVRQTIVNHDLGYDRRGF